MGTTLTLERYAELRAEMESAYLRDDVLARAGITTDEWTGAQREWLDRMGTELARSQFELTNRYSQAFLGRQRALQAIASPRDAAPPAVPVAVPLESLEPKTPTSLSAVPDPHINPSSIDALQARPASDRFPARSSPELSAEAVAATRAVPDDSPGTSTLPLPPFEQHWAKTAAPLPFTTAASTAPAPHAASPWKLPEGLCADTTLPPAAFDEIRRAANSPLPFQPGSAQSETTISREPPPAPSPIAPYEGPASMAQTADLTSFAQRFREQRKGALPFESAGAVQRKSSSNEPRGSAGSAPLGPLDVTGEISPAVQQALTGKSSPLPFRESQGLASPPRLPSLPEAPEASPAAMRPTPRATPASLAGAPCRLTLEQFASLSAEMAITPKAALPIRARYGLDEASHTAETGAWQRRFSADQELFKRYSGLYQSYREWLATKKP